MPANRTKSVRVGCLAGLLLGLLAGIVLAIRYQNITNCYENRPLLTSFGVMLGPDQVEQLVEQSRQFAYKNSFRLDVGVFDPQDEEFRIRMLREDVEVIAKRSGLSGSFEVGFYNYDCINPTTVSDVGELVNDFKSLIGEIPNVVITEAK
ncbi:MAG: hypothetical protein WCC12_01440 [Anaerolineales bacterium]